MQDTRETIVLDMREGAAVFAERGERVAADALKGFAKRVEGLGEAHGDAPAGRLRETVADIVAEMRNLAYRSRILCGGEISLIADRIEADTLLERADAAEGGA